MTQRRLSRSQSVVNKLVSSFKKEYDEDTITSRLEAEIALEEKPVPKSKLSRLRRKGSLILHSKQVLMVIVLLNVIDCLLVTGELILDIHYIKDILDESDLQSQTFVDQMQERYPNHIYGHDIDHLDSFYKVINQANCYWDNEEVTKYCGNSTNQRRKLLAAVETLDEHGDMTSEKKAKEAHAHSIWEEISHGLHKTSIAILAVLCAEALLKIFFMGKHFFHHKIEVFDAFVIIASFIVDLVFLKGLTIYRIQDGILILSFLLPWRIVRVLNSLVVAVLDNEHFRLKMMYKQKKALENDMDLAKDKIHALTGQLHQIEDFLEKEGMPRWKFVHYTHFDEKNLSLASMASYTLKSVMENFVANQRQMGTILEHEGTDQHTNNNKQHWNDAMNKDTQKIDTQKTNGILENILDPKDHDAEEAGKQNTSNGLNTNMHGTNGFVNGGFIDDSDKASRTRLESPVSNGHAGGKGLVNDIKPIVNEQTTLQGPSKDEQDVNHQLTSKQSPTASGNNEIGNANQQIGNQNIGRENVKPHSTVIVIDNHNGISGTGHNEASGQTDERMDREANANAMESGQDTGKGNTHSKMSEDPTDFYSTKL